MTTSSSRDDAPFDWDVLPAERRRAIGDAPPKGAVRVRQADDKPEYLKVPASVARSLARKKKAKELDPQSREEMFEAIASVSADVARNRIAQMFTRRDYSRKEVRDKLLLEGFEPDVVDSAVTRGAQAGLISDRRFADVFIRTKVAAGWGKGRIERELGRKGIVAAECPGWPHEYLDPDDEITRALEVARRKRVKEPHAREKLARFLVGRGFSFSVALDAARTVLEEQRDAW